MSLDILKAKGDAPDWLTQAGYETLSQGYLLEGETPRDMYRRVANSVALHLKKPELADKFYKYIDNNWLCLASPVSSNCGTARGLPISCYSLNINDSIAGIADAIKEAMMLTKNGGGLGSYFGNLRPMGSNIGNGSNGKSGSILPWMKQRESTMEATAQGGVRRGNEAMYLHIRSNEIIPFIDLKRKTGDQSRRCNSSSIHHAVCIDDLFMQEIKQGNEQNIDIWLKLLEVRHERGEPYLMFPDTANRLAPQWMKDRGLHIYCSNLCNEIYLPIDNDHTFVCCLSSLNLARWDEWKDTDLVETAIWFLDGVMEEFIQKADGQEGFERSVRFAKKSRALGLGVVGWHTLLQQRMIPFESFPAMTLNNIIFKTIKERADLATQQLAIEYGEPEWLKGYGIRNGTLIAIAPTRSNALISGGVSQGIEPIESNFYPDKTAKGVFEKTNPQLKKLLEIKGEDTEDVWQEISSRLGSVKSLKFLSEQEKQVFATAREINQMAIVQQAAQRQNHIDQGQSMNLFFPKPEELSQKYRMELAEYIHDVHWAVWELGLKGAYYLRPSALLQGDSVSRSDCLSCEA